MAIDVRRGGDVAVTEPLLDQLHLHALRDQERGAGVAQSVKTNIDTVCALCYNDLTGNEALPGVLPKPPFG